MAGFGDANDIKINVTLDTKSAVESVEELKTSIKQTLEITKSQFLRISEISKSLNKVAVENIKSRERIELERLKNEDAANQRSFSVKLAQIATVGKNTDKQISANLQAYLAASAAEVKTARAGTTERIANARIESRERIRLFNDQLKAAKDTAKTEIDIFKEKENTKRLEIKKTIAEIEQETVRIRKTRIPKAAPPPTVPSEGDNAFGSGKLVDSLSRSIAGLSVQLGPVNIGLASFIGNLKQLGIGGPISAAATAAAVLVVALQKLSQNIDELTAQAGKLEGIKTGFETLQKTVGQAPLQSIEALRVATQGLITDTELYQKANQAVLLGVPTATFNQAAAAAVKLGRAMGIDAAFGLESLSLGLGRQSRLYLDNLGIIVSAEEAYRNFGATVGKSAADLDDAEKKAAFFAEALKKIKERADELPDPLDTAAIAQTKANVAQENGNRIFLEAINNTRSLAEAYQFQQAIAQQNAKNAYVFGAALGEVSAKAKNSILVFSALSSILKSGLAEALDRIFKFSPAREFEALKLEVEATKKEIEKLTPWADKTKTLGIIAASNAMRIDELNKKLEEDQKRLELLKTILGELDGTNIKVNIDLSGIETAQENLKTIFADIQSEAQREAGVFKIPGLPDQEAAAIIDKYRAAKEQFDASIKDTTALEAFQSKIQEVEQAITGAPIKQATKELATEATNLIGALSSGEITTAKQIFSGLGSSIANVAKSARASQVSVKALGAVITAVDKRTATSTKKATKAAEDAQEEAKKRIKQQEQFLKGLKRASQAAIPTDLDSKIREVFKSAEIGTDEFIEKLKELGFQFEKNGGDLEAFNARIREYVAFKNKLGTVPLTDPQSLRNIQDYNDQLKQAQSGTVNLRDIFLGAQNDPNVKKKGGAFFGFDILGSSEEGISNEVRDSLLQSEGQIADAFQGVLSTAFQAGADGFTREDVPTVAAAIGTAIGTAIGAAIGGPAGAAIGAAAGNVLGGAAGELIVKITAPNQITKAKKSVDEFFGEIFDGRRLGLLIEGRVVLGSSHSFGTGIGDQLARNIIEGTRTQLESGEFVAEVRATLAKFEDLVFTGTTTFGGDVKFGDPESGFFDFFNTLEADAKSAFAGIGLAFGTLAGLSEEYSNIIGVAIANNIGGSLQNLQIFIQATGKSLEELSQTIIAAFLDSQLSIEDAYNSLAQLQMLFEEGIPGAIGAYEEAISNLNKALTDNRPGRYAIDSLRDIAVEGIEAGKSFDFVVAKLAGTFEFTAQQQQKLFEALKLAGISSLADLQNASTEQLLAILRNIQLIRENAEAPLVAPTTIQKPQTTTPRGPSAPKAPSGPSPEDARKRALQQLRDETARLIKESLAYEKILERLTAKEISNTQAGIEILKLRKQIEGLLKTRNKLEDEYEKLLEKGDKANKKRLGRVADLLDQNKKKLDELTEKAKNGADAFKQLDLKAIIPFIKSANSLGVVSRVVGVDLGKVSDILIQGFLQGKLTLQELNEQLKKTQENLGKGIPNEVGAVTKAFQNLVDAGVKGGQFSVDAFSDIFAEFRERFQKEGSAAREQERKNLLAALEDAKLAQKNAVGPEAAKSAKEALDAAKKALDDFYATIPAPDLADLRADLEKSFGVEQISKFFQAIDESGLRTFTDLEKAGADGIIPILTRLTELGFKFNETSDEIKNIQIGLQDAEKAANGNKDPVQAALDLIKQFNAGAESLPPAFNSTTEAVGGLNSTLSQLSDGFDGIIEKLSLLSGQTYKNDVVFNVRTEGDSSSQALIEILFGDGSTVGGGTGNGGGGGGGGGGGSDVASKIAAKRKRLSELNRKGKSNSEEAKRLRKEIRQLSKEL